MYKNLTNKALLQLSSKFGKNALEARRKFAGTLPEIHRRKLYKPKFQSIFHYAKLVGGLSEAHVRRTLNLSEDFSKDKPTLHTMLIKGEASAHKLKVIKSIATPHNEASIAQLVKNMSKAALEVYVKDAKMCRNTETGLQEKFDSRSVPEDTNSYRLFECRKPSNHIIQIASHFSAELQQNLLQRVQKGININNLLMELLEKHDQEIEEQKEKIAQEEKLTQEKTQKKTRSRYIPIKVKNIIKKEHGTKCSIPHCTKPAENLHHTRRFAITNSHDPRYIAPLCKPHHQVAHTIDRKYQQKLRC